MGDRLLSGQPQLGVGTHEAADEMFGLLTDVAPEVVVEVIPPLDNLPEEFALPTPMLLETSFTGGEMSTTTLPPLMLAPESPPTILATQDLTLHTLTIS